MSSVLVYILTDNKEAEHTCRLAEIFHHDMFEIQYVPYADENEKVLWILKDSAAKDKADKHLLIIKDTSITNASSEHVRKTIDKAIVTNGYHLCYLCKWMDRCDLYTDVETLHIEGKTTVIAKSQAPHGIQALLITPEGRDILIGKRQTKKGTTAGLLGNPNNKQERRVKNIEDNAELDKKAIKEVKDKDRLNNTVSRQLTELVLDGHIDAICVVPNIFDFDITKATKNSDYMKTMECLPPPYSNQANAASNKLGSYAVFFFLILLIILGLFFLIAGYPK